MMTPTTASAPPTCEARTGQFAGEYAELPLWCHSRIGLSTWTDRRGITHRACRHHRAAMQRIYPVYTFPVRTEANSEACRFCGDTSAIVDGRYVLVAFGNGTLGVVCDNCVEKADDEPDDPEDEFDREGQPEFNGAFR